jgi:hypothetical protein
VKKCKTQIGNARRNKNKERILKGKNQEHEDVDEAYEAAFSLSIRRIIVRCFSFSRFLTSSLHFDTREGPPVISSTNTGVAPAGCKHQFSRRTNEKEEKGEFIAQQGFQTGTQKNQSVQTQAK